MPIVFLNPLKKEMNNCIYEGSGAYYINLIINKMIPYLRASGIKYTRDVQAHMCSWDNLGFFIGSDATVSSINKKFRGLNICYMLGNPSSRRLAKILRSNVTDLYPDKQNIVMSPLQTSEIPINCDIPCILFKIACRNNLDDLNWIKINVEKISKNLAMSLCEYFSVPLIVPIPIKTTILNREIGLYSKPILNSNSFISLPRGSKISIVGNWGNWYVISCSGETGYTPKALKPKNQ